jgi:hypothetical protein
MKVIKKKELQEKGWTEKEIRNTENILDEEKAYDAHFSKIVFWSALIVIIFANLIVSLVLIPFLIVLNKWVLFTTVILLAGTVGFLYNFLINDIGHLQRRHHVLAAIIIPILTLANMITMVLVSNRFIRDLNVDNVQHNPWVVAIVFAVAFILPYVFDKLVLRRN